MSSNFKKIGIIAKTNKKEAIDTLSVLVPWLAERGIETVLDSGAAKQIGIKSDIAREDVPKTSDMVIVLGGDGTLLYAARVVGESEIPILGVNLGSLGFLTEVALPELYNTMERVISGDFRLDRHSEPGGSGERDPAY